MTIYNFGSINLDHLYQVDHFVRPGETMASLNYQCLLGGKGANQSVALAKAGADIKHVGAIQKTDQSILEQLDSLGVNTDLIAQIAVPTGHAIIQLTKEAENAILLYPGANHELTEEQVDVVLQNAGQDDWVLLQNETNLVEYITEQAAKKGLKVAFNPAPMDASLTRKILKHVDLLIVNEVEAMDLAEADTVASAAELLPKQYPELAVLMTLGQDGVRYFNGNIDLSVPAFRVEAKDTTAAGDTFIGFTLSALLQDKPIQEAMRMGCAASAICVTRMGASVAIPTLTEVTEFLAQQS